MGKTRVPDINEQNEVRDEYTERIQKLVLGPGSEDTISKDTEQEVISESPKMRYVTGILYSEDDINKGKDDTDNKTEVVQFEDIAEDPITIDNSFKAGSMGITFYCKSASSKVEACIKTASYNKILKPFVDVSEEMFEQLWKFKNLKIFDFKENPRSVALSGETKDEIIKSRNDLKEAKGKFPHSLTHFLEYLIGLYYGQSFYKREPHQCKIVIPIDKNNSDNHSIKCEDGHQELIDVFSKTQVMETKLLGKVTAVTIVIKNKMDKALFQSNIRVNKQPDMKFYSSEDVKMPDLEKLQYEDAMNIFLYRNNKTYASGHGVSACWDLKNGEVSSVFTTFIPTYEILPTNTENSEIPDDVLNPASYIDGDYQNQSEKLIVFIDKYENWINKTKENVDSLEGEFQKLALKNIDHCLACAKRMRETVTFLRSDAEAFNAFNIANETMLLQRMTDYHQKQKAYKTKNYSNVKFRWRPFQLAFILNSLESVLNPESKHRDDLDLIWVPTGGGKTEAYLFAIAAIIAYRRLTRKKGYQGVTVIMRYTLRLLTSQQFERAAKMICALEYIRKTRGNLGETEVSIGLWIGEGTENYLKNARSDYNEMCRADTIIAAKKLNKFQLLNCPWCGKKHSIIPDEENHKKSISWGYKEINNKNAYNMCCLTKDCPFNKGLPVYVVDESIYSVRPTLIFGTVDKFAQIPLKQQAQRLFGSDNPQKYNRPDLIVQDELHLISGPLGSIVGLYEAGFDYILRNSNHHERGPKYIASTATIRNASDQIKGIFDRNVQLFPPRGIIATDNFFVKETKQGHGRKYFGIMGTGKSQMTVEVHTMAAMLQSAVKLGRDASSEELFWTIAGYFNSLRELGKASSLIRDDIRDYLKQLAKRLNLLPDRRRSLSDVGAKELTSRIAGNRIPDIIKQLKVPHDEILEDKTPESNKQPVIDTLLATNMLSVGIDISRLNTMLVIGQPKLTSEYIQATSRVGRESLGAVFTLYSSTRSRDRSHYETFQAYHQSLYKYVEPSSVTPFSVPAMQKGIPGVIAAMLRNTVEALSGDDCPENILDPDNKRQLERIREFLMTRVKDSEDNYHLYRKDAQKIIDEFCRRWEQLAQQNNENKNESEHQKFLYYKYMANSDEYDGNLLLKSFNDKSHEEAINVMESMREVEDTSFVDIEGDIEK